MRVLLVAPLDAETRLRVQVKHVVPIGPGKADVLQAIAETVLIAEAGRQLGMRYQRVWSQVRAMNGDFVEPLVLPQHGGTAGGGAGLPPWERMPRELGIELCLPPAMVDRYPAPPPGPACAHPR